MDAVGSLPSAASGCLHLNHNPFHYVVPANVLSSDQSRFLDDTCQDCGRGVAWAGNIRPAVGPFPGWWPRWLTRQHSEQRGAAVCHIRTHDVSFWSESQDWGGLEHRLVLSPTLLMGGRWGHGS